MSEHQSEKISPEDEKRLLLPTHNPPKRRIQVLPLFTGILITAAFIIYIIPSSLYSFASSTVQNYVASNKCASISLPELPGFTITSIESHTVYNYAFPDLRISGLNFCNVTVIHTHEGANDTVFASIWLPLSNWNDRLMVTGGGGLRASFESSVAFATYANYVGASTDAGLSLSNTIDPGTGKWALRSDGSLNTELVKNFADRSIHDLAVISKAATKAFYGREAEYNYYAGCSTGGRMGYFAAQKHPEDFDGILATAPAIDMPALAVADFWPVVVMAETVFPPPCVFELYEEDILTICDPLDGVTDGLISHLGQCTYDAKRLIGRKVTCDDGDLIVTSQHAEVIDKILEGPTSKSGESLFSGNAPGSSFAGLALTAVVNDTVVSIPFSPTEDWIRYFVEQDPTFDTRHMTFAQFRDSLKNSIKTFNEVFGVDSPDLSEFKAHGGKVLTWHGLADELITPELTVSYRKKLESNMGGSKAVDEFQRLFFAPGVAHCQGGYGPEPDLLGSINVLRDWVELGAAPEILAASTTIDGVVITRDLCLYPRRLKYDGMGDVNSASSFTCE